MLQLNKACTHLDLDLLARDERNKAEFWINRKTLKEATSISILEDMKKLSFRREFGRQIAWLGTKDINYRYANKNHLNTIDFSFAPAIHHFTRFISKEFSQDFNHLLINLYSDNDKLNAHKDDEPELTGAIASLSLGDTARFTFADSHIDLEHGHFTIGNREFFNNFSHSVSPTFRGKIRFNLTWRTISS